MSQAWYQVLSICFGYLSAAIVVMIVMLSVRQYLSDRALVRRIRRNLPQAGTFARLQVLNGGRRLSAGEEIAVPYEGTMGSSHSCDVCIPVRKVHMRSAFFWVEEDELHMVALHRDGFLVDDVPVEPGDEAVLGDGAVLRVGEAKMVLRIYHHRSTHSIFDGPYVTRARRGKAQLGKGDGIGAPSKAEARREKKLQNKLQKKQQEKHQEKHDRMRKR